MSTQEIVLTGGENAQQVSTWDPNSGAALPAYLADTQEELGSNIPDRNTVPSLSYEGKMWQIVKDGNRQKLQIQNSDGDLVPVPIMRCVVLNFNADRGRAYYPDNYNPAAAAAPKCWSADGKAPDPSVREKQSALCNGCPMSIKGSKVDGGRELVACSAHRMLAIAPVFDLESDPLRLKIAVTSDYDKEVVEHGWYAFRQYVDFLKSRGITNTALVVTKIKFDPTPAYPKLLFAIDRVLTQAEVVQVKQALQNPKVAELLAEKWTAAGSNGTPIDDSDIKPHGLEGAYLDGWIAHPDAAGYSYKGTEVVANAELAARYPAPAPKPEPTPTPTPPPAPSAASTPSAPAPATVDPLDAARADGWIAHPDAAGYHYKGSEVVVNSDLVARYSARVEDTAPPAPQAPPPAPEPEPAPKVADKSPRELAEQDGWVQHPDSAPHGYKGSEVLDWSAIEAKYAGNGASTATSAAPEVPAASSAGQTAPSGASPTDTAAVPDDVQNLLNKWTS